MFSRTTMASSISRPMHNDSAISVMKLSEKPRKCSAMNVAMAEIGSVRPVITVERHECRNRNTIRTVRSAPSTMVSLTRSSEPSIHFASDHSVRIFVLGQPALQLRDGLFDAGADLHQVRLLRAIHGQRDRAHAVDARDRLFF